MWMKEVKEDIKLNTFKASMSDSNENHYVKIFIIFCPRRANLFLVVITNNIVFL